MFHSFFPNPRVFFASALVWTAFLIFIWFLGLFDSQSALNLFESFAPVAVDGERAPFLTKERLWTYTFVIFSGVIFAGFWTSYTSHRWKNWSVWGSTLIILWTYFEVQISLYLNDWFGGFYDMIQQAMANPNTIPLETYLGSIWLITVVLTFRIGSLVLLGFFTSHYVFRWRTAMNDYYMRHWQNLRRIEGAAQRVQEDTMRFGTLLESVGTHTIKSVMTLIAFLPLLWVLSDNIKEVPFFGEVEKSLVYLALLSAIFGTVVLALIGIKLPGLEFNNQKVEAAYRKELVYGEDDSGRAEPGNILILFKNVRTNYFRLYFHYVYFDIVRYFYLQGSVFIPLIAMGPSIVTGAITFGIYRQVQNAFSEVEDALRFLVTSWKTIIELMSIYKRLIGFESQIEFDPTPDAALSEDTVVAAN